MSSERQFGQVLGPIPWHRIVEYGERKRLDPAMAEVFLHVIRKLDDVYQDDLRQAQALAREQVPS